MVKYGRVLFVTIIFIYGCKVQYKKLVHERRDYVEDVIKTDGYFFNLQSSIKSERGFDVDVLFFYKNGVFYDPFVISIQDSTNFEQEFFSKYPRFIKDKEIPYAWGIFFAKDGKLVVERWGPGAGWVHPTFIANYTVINDTTIRYDYNNAIYHFRSYSPKPDSTNQFIP